MTETVAIEFRAFLSYSHADAGWAKWLHARLEGFRIDKDLVGRVEDKSVHPGRALWTSLGGQLLGASDQVSRE